MQSERHLVAVKIRAEFTHRIFFTHDIFAPTNDVLAQILMPERPNLPARLLAVVDGSLPELCDQIAAYCAANGIELCGEPIRLPAGEALKNDPDIVRRLQEAIWQRGLSRHSYVVAVGGGALLDVAGYAAATAHRGVRLVRVPTTTLSQADGGVGVKNGVNLFGVKNFAGTFAVPHAVINDATFLQSLPPRELRAGFAEAVKVALIRDADFFEALWQRRERLARFEMESVEWLVRRCAEIHVSHIATSGDPFETGSARPLDFGHWSAHWLEQASGFRIGHGDAVATGVALDVLHSREAGWLDDGDAARVLTLLTDLGFTLWQEEIGRCVEGRLEILDGLEAFREHLGGELTLTLLRVIGEGFEVHALDPAHVAKAAGELKEGDASRHTAHRRS